MDKKRKYRKRRNLVDDDFFRSVALNAGVSDLEVVRDVIYGMIRTLSRELKEKQTVMIPDWGAFSLKVHKERRGLNVRINKVCWMPKRFVVKFVPIRKVKQYFYAFGRDHGIEGE